VSTSVTESLTPTLTQENLYAGRIVVFTLSSMTRETIDAWVDGCLAYMKSCWGAGEPLLLLQDLSHQHIAQTPYAKQRGTELSQAYPELGGRVGFVLPRSANAQNIRLFARSLSNQRREHSIFMNREQALAWLAESL